MIRQSNRRIHGYTVIESKCSLYVFLPQLGDSGVSRWVTNDEEGSRTICALPEASEASMIRTPLAGTPYGSFHEITADDEREAILKHGYGIFNPDILPEIDPNFELTDVDRMPPESLEGFQILYKEYRPKRTKS